MPDTIAVLAHAGDTLARELVERWPDGAARLLTPVTLASWDCRVAFDRNGAFAGPPSGAGDVAGVLSLMSEVLPTDLPHVAAEERAYVAAETTAFLGAWLRATACPKLNPPSFTSLRGELHPLSWRAHALRCGVRVAAFDPAADAAGENAEDIVVVGIVGDCVDGADDAAARTWARAIARSARLPMASVGFVRDAGGLTFRHALAVADLSAPRLLDAAARWFGAGGA